MKNPPSENLISRSLVVIITLLLAAMASMQSVNAVTITVANTNDSGAGSLRQALADANDGDAIDLTTVSGTITLTTGELLVNKSVTITGPGAGNLAVDGNAAGRVFFVTSPVTVTISGLTITNGNAPQPGIAEYFGYGGGIFNDFYTTLTVSNCTISANSAMWGGGIYSAHSTLTVVSNSTISGNSAFYGGGIVNDGYVYSGTLALNNSTISGNSASYYGGGIWNYGAGSGSATMTINNSTLSGNSASLGGGSIWNTHDQTGNGSSTLTIGDTILNVGASGENVLNDSGTVTSEGYNLSNDNGSGYLTSTGDQINADPMLGPLQNNGGPTFTHALLTGSPAIDHGKNFSGSTADQRGTGFARTVDFSAIPNATGGDGTDIGAFELQHMYSAHVQPPINADGTSIFTVQRGVVPVKFSLFLDGISTCTLPPATIAVTRTAGGTPGAINESVYSMSADSGSNFRIDSCQYIYNLRSSLLGVGTYRVDIIISGQVVGSGIFQLK